MRRDQVAAWLAEHRPSDAEEAAHVRTVLDAVAGVADPFDRRTAAPGHVTASAFVLSPGGDDVLLVLHGALGRWLQPGGHVEPEDADLVAAAWREVVEETGLTELTWIGASRLLDVDVHAIPARPQRGEPEHLHLDLRVAFRAAGTEVAAGDGVRDARWVALDEVASLETDRSVMRALERLRGVERAARARPLVPDRGVGDPRIDEVLRYWFGSERPPSAERQRAWWSHAADVDEDVRRRFAALHHEASEGGLTSWAGEPRGRVALVIVLDQLSRHLHRDAPGMFANDARAAGLALDAVAEGWIPSLDLHERLFLLMPLMHAEDAALQDVSVAAFRQLAEDAARIGTTGFDGNVAFALRHREIVDRFGRFPHRNAILGRDSTPEELAFLQEPGSSF